MRPDEFNKFERNAVKPDSGFHSKYGSSTLVRTFLNLKNLKHLSYENGRSRGGGLEWTGKPTKGKGH
jgi:hypothetical protein